MTRVLTLLGATGSIGASTLDLVRRNRDEWQVEALTAQCSAAELAALAIEYQPLTTILLFGQLRQFGRSFRLSVRTTAEAIKALCVQVPGFERFLSNG